MRACVCHLHHCHVVDHMTSSVSQVCAHTWQSMKDRYRRYIVPKIRSYSLQKHEVARLTGNVYDAAEKRKAQGTEK